MFFDYQSFQFLCSFDDNYDSDHYDISNQKKYNDSDNGSDNQSRVQWSTISSPGSSGPLSPVPVGEGLGDDMGQHHWLHV